MRDGERERERDDHWREKDLKRNLLKKTNDKEILNSNSNKNKNQIKLRFKKSNK